MNEEQPPVFRNWKTWYLLVLAVLVMQLVVFVLLTRSFS
jgi:hypothetical protein